MAKTKNTPADFQAVSRDVFSATVGSFCCCYAGQPLDTMKVRMQTNPAQYTSFLSTSRQIFSNEGIAAFWKGAVPTAFGMMGENAVAFSINEALKRHFSQQREQQQSTIRESFLLGPVTGCCAALVLCPAEVVKAKKQVIVGKGMSDTDIIRQMIRQQGIKSIMCGLDGQFMRDGCFYTVFFGGYEFCKCSFRNYFPSMPDELNYYISGGLAGMGGWIVGMPFDVPKTVVQSSWDTRVFGSYFPTLVKIARERGVRQGLYAGIGPALVRAFVANSALFLGVETGKEFFDNVLSR